MGRVLNIFMLFFLVIVYSQEKNKKFHFNKITFSIYFDIKSSKIKKNQLHIIDSIQKYYPYRKTPHYIEGIYLYGYTDSQGDKKKNMLLSSDRVIAVEHILQENGINQFKFIDRKGEINDGSIKNKKNRRVDIIIPIDKRYVEKNSN